ncbi:MAG: helix-turn-helix transcriptional regulator [Elusimicrobia bacterium]|nr:helix-turn-helix transcriptional regulator [Elusimicrobiota bacterium]
MGRQLWYLRIRQHLTQGQLAHKAGITQARLSRIEAGADFNWSTISAIFAALGYEPILLPGPLGRVREARPYRKPWRKTRERETASGGETAYLSVRK